MSTESKPNVKQQRRQPLPPATGYAPLVILPTTTPPETVKDVRAAGYVPVLTDDPEGVRLVIGHSEISGSDMLMAAMHGLVTGGYTPPKEHFVKELYARMQRREGA